MSKKVFISSNQQSKQIQKFQLSQRKQSQTYLFHHQNSGSNQFNQNQSKLQKIIYDKIAEVQNQNQKLLNIANQLNHSSMSFTINDQLSNLVYPIQEQMKLAFNELIESIQEFYIDIDTKIKQIGGYLATLSGIDTLETSKKDHDDMVFSSNLVNHTNHQPEKQKPSSLTNEQQTIRSINMKIEMMQKDLEETKSNQNKLMSIIEKLVEKYELTNETTIVKEEPFLRKKIHNIVSRVVDNDVRRVNQSPQNFRADLCINRRNQQFVQGNTFSRPNYKNHLSHNMNSGCGPSISSNAARKSQNPHRIVPNLQNPNDYSLYQELNKIQENPTIQNQQSFATSNFSQPKDIFAKKKPRPTLILPQKLDVSMMSVNSYAYSNSIDEQDEDQCFIKKLYSKQAPSLNKVSLKSCNNANKTVFQLNRPQEETPIEQSNKNHREAYLLNQLKKFN